MKTYATQNVNWVYVRIHAMNLFKNRIYVDNLRTYVHNAKYDRRRQVAT